MAYQYGQFNQKQGNMNNPQQRIKNNQEVPTRQPLTLDVEPIKFVGTQSAMQIRDIDLSLIINSLFKEPLSDYEGCVVAPDLYDNGKIKVALYFKDKGEPTNPKSKKAIQPIVLGAKDINRTDMKQRLMNMNRVNKNRTYELTQDAKDILSEFIETNNRNKINWNAYTLEQPDSNAYGMNYSIAVRVSGIDIYKLLKKIYGSYVEVEEEDDKGRTIKMKQPLQYNISIVKAIGANVPGATQSYLFNILQLNATEVDRLVAKLGYVPQIGIPMVRA